MSFVKLYTYTHKHTERETDKKHSIQIHIKTTHALTQTNTLHKQTPRNINTDTTHTVQRYHTAEAHRQV